MELLAANQQFNGQQVMHFAYLMSFWQPKIPKNSIHIHTLSLL